MFFNNNNQDYDSDTGSDLEPLKSGVSFGGPVDVFEFKSFTNHGNLIFPPGVTHNLKEGDMVQFITMIGDNKVNVSGKYLSSTLTDEQNEFIYFLEQQKWGVSRVNKDGSVLLKIFLLIG